MVQIGIVWVRMDQPPVPMRMVVRLRICHRRIVGPVLMLVMFVVHVGMIVLHFFVNMLMLVTLTQMKAYPKRHTRRPDTERDGWLLAPANDRERHSDERRQRKVCAGARSAEMP